MRKKQPPKTDWSPEDAIEKRRRWLFDKREILFFLQRLFMIGAFTGLLLGVIFGVYSMNNDDMRPRISAGDVLFYFRWDRDFVQRDVVIYRTDGRKRVGRIVGRPGDSVEVTADSKLLVNGYVSYEENIFYSTPDYDGKLNYPVNLGEDEYFILADYREGAKDSRYYGQVSEKQIIGKVFAVIRWMDL